jgi:hypothetical protein
MRKVETSPKVHDKLVALADRYLDLYARRNQIVHGSHVEGAVIRLKRPNKDLRNAMVKQLHQRRGAVHDRPLPPER